jgi:transcription antitermination protein NusB
LYSWDMRGGNGFPDHVARELEYRRVSPRYRPYVDRLVRGLDSELPTLDATLEDTMPNWRLDRLSAIDRNVLRIGVLELTFDDIPPRVAIHEAIRLAERYGADESPRFVNGVLDAVHRRVPIDGR